jgi:hypothetical protein
MRVVWEPCCLGSLRRGDRALAGAAGEHDLASLGVGDLRRIKLGKRDNCGARIALKRGLIGLAHVNQQHASFGQTTGNFRRCQIAHFWAIGVVHGHLHSRACEQALEERLIVDRLAVEKKPLDRRAATRRHRGDNSELAIVARLFDVLPLALRDEEALQAIVELDG